MTASVDEMIKPHGQESAREVFRLWNTGSTAADRARYGTRDDGILWAHRWTMNAAEDDAGHKSDGEGHP